MYAREPTGLAKLADHGAFPEYRSTAMHSLFADPDGTRSILPTSSCCGSMPPGRCRQGQHGPMPLRRNGPGLPYGIDDVITTDLPELGVPPEPTALRALAIAIPARRAAAEPAVAEGDASAGRRAGLSDLIAPVRPNWKARYPLTPIPGCCTVAA